MKGMPAVSISMPMEESPMDGPTWWRQWKSATHAEALTHIVEAHGGLVLRTCQRILLNEADAQDAAQEVFLRLHKTLKQFDQERELLPWLYRMTVNVCHDLHRRKRPVTILEPASEPAASGPTPEERFSAEERRKLLFEALGREPALAEDRGRSCRGAHFDCLCPARALAEGQHETTEA